LICIANIGLGIGFDTLRKQVAHAVSLTNFKLHLAGKLELLTSAQIYLPPEQIVFHGEVSRDELFLIIHSVDLVCVPSICFDVYPTITIESLSHGTPVLTHRTCGGIEIFPSNSVYIQPYDQQINLEQLRLPKIEKFTSSKISDVIVELESMLREFE
jgi:glycosyltransferase involved in cell wall biosynthesis